MGREEDNNFVLARSPDAPHAQFVELMPPPSDGSSGAGHPGAVVWAMFATAAVRQRMQCIARNDVSVVHLNGQLHHLHLPTCHRLPVVTAGDDANVPCLHACCLPALINSTSQTLCQCVHTHLVAVGNRLLVYSLKVAREIVDSGELLIRKLLANRITVKLDLRRFGKQQ